MTCAQIPAAEIQWINDSFVDPSGRVFEWRGEIYRAIHPSHVAFWQHLFDNGNVHELVRDNLLVSSELTELKSDPGTLVIHHKKVPVVSYCFEWSPGMLKQAALLTLELCIRLAEKELTLQDAHPWNILFDGHTPVFIDLGSMTPVRQNNLGPLSTVLQFFLVSAVSLFGKLRSASPLAIAGLPVRSHRRRCPCGAAFFLQTTSSRSNIQDLGTEAHGQSTSDNLPQPWRSHFLSLAQAANSNLVHAGVRIKFLEALRKDIETLKFDSRRSQWTGYYDTVDESYLQRISRPESGI